MDGTRSVTNTAGSLGIPARDSILLLTYLLSSSADKNPSTDLVYLYHHDLSKSEGRESLKRRAYEIQSFTYICTRDHMTHSPLPIESQVLQESTSPLLKSQLLMSNGRWA